MAHERGESVEPFGRVDPFAIPAQQAPNGERVPQAMQPWRRHSLGDAEFEARNEVMECLACGAWMHAAAAIEAEQRVVDGTARSSFGLPGEEFSDAWSVWDETALAELAAPHHEELAVGVDVAQSQPASLTGAEPEAVAESEDGVICAAAVRGPSVVRKRCGSIEEPAGLHDVDQERYVLGGFAASPGL